MNLLLFGRAADKSKNVKLMTYVNIFECGASVDTPYVLWSAFVNSYGICLPNFCEYVCAHCHASRAKKRM